MTATTPAEQTGGAPEPTGATAPTWLPLAAVGVTLVLWASAFVAIRHLAGTFSPGSLSLGRLLVGCALPRRGRAESRTAPPHRGDVGLDRDDRGALVRHLQRRPQRRRAARRRRHRRDADPGLTRPGRAAGRDLPNERFTLYLGARPGPRVRWRRADRDRLRRSNGDRSVLGVVLCLVAAVVYSISLVLQKPLVAQLPAIHVTWLACTVGAVVCLPFVGRLVDDTRVARRRPTSGGSSTSASSRPRSRSPRSPTRCAACPPAAWA